LHTRCAYQATFIANLASVLGIDQSRIRVAKVVPGSAIVSIEIGEAPAASAAPMPEKPFNMTYNMDVSTSLTVLQQVLQSVQQPVQQLRGRRHDTAAAPGSSNGLLSSCHASSKALLPRDPAMVCCHHAMLVVKCYHHAIQAAPSSFRGTSSS
jgi:hypothetical protein